MLGSQQALCLPFHQLTQTTPHKFGVNVAANSFLGRLSLSQPRVRDSRWRRGVRSDWRPMWARLHGWRRRTNDEELDEELEERGIVRCGHGQALKPSATRKIAGLVARTRTLACTLTHICTCGYTNRGRPTIVTIETDRVGLVFATPWGNRW